MNAKELELKLSDSLQREDILKEKIAALEARCAALAAENAGMKKYCKDAAFDADYESELGMERGGFTDALNDIKTTATDAFLAEVRARAVEEFVRMADYSESVVDGGVIVTSNSVFSAGHEYAAQLRKGVQS